LTDHYGYGRKFFSEEPNSYVGAQNCALSLIQIQILIAGVAADVQTTTHEDNIIDWRTSLVSMIQRPLAHPMTAYIGYDFSRQCMGPTRPERSGLRDQCNDGHLFSREINSHQSVEWMRAGEMKVEVKLSLKISV